MEDSPEKTTRAGRATVNSPKDMTPLDMALNEQQVVMAEVDKMFARLTDQLQPVLAPASPEPPDAPGEDDRVRSSVVQTVLNRNRDLREIRDHIQLISDRLEV